MFHKPQKAAPEPYHSAALWLLYRVSLMIRNDPMSPQQIQDLADAIHNVPESLSEYGYYFDETKIRELYLEAYDEKWVRSERDISLVRTLDRGIELAQQWHRANPPEPPEPQR